MSNQKQIVALNTTLAGRAIKAGTAVDDLDPAPTKEWLADAKKTGTVKIVNLEPEPGPDGSGGGDVDPDEPGFKDEAGSFIPLKSLKVPELKEIAKDSEVEGYAQMGKDQLIEAIVKKSEPADGGEQ